MSGIDPSSFRSLLHRKEGVSTRAPSLGRGCRAQRGGVGFLFCGEAASSLRSPFPMRKAKRRRLRRKKGSQPRLAALGSPFQGKELAWTLPPSYGRRCPEGAEVGWGWRYEKKRRGASQVCRLRKHPIHRCAVPLPQWGRLRYEDTAIPEIKPSPRG